MLAWKMNNDDTVTLEYERGKVIVSKTDFNRAFGTMINSSYEDVKRDFQICK